MDSVKNKFSCFNPIAGEVDDDDECPLSPPHSSAVENRRRKKSRRPTLSGFFKAIFFQTPLLKKLRSKRSKRDSSKFKKHLTKKNQIQMSGNKSSSDLEEDQPYSRDNSDRSSLFSSRSSSSLASSDSSFSSSGSELITIKASTDYPVPEQTNKIRRHAIKLVRKSRKYDCKGLLFIILVCLAALIFCGKVFAIVSCTSAWLFLAPGRARTRCGLRSKDVAVGSEEHKKRVIMDGLLERNLIRSKVVQ